MTTMLERIQKMQLDREDPHEMGRKKTKGNRWICCPTCGKTDPTCQSVMKIWHELIILNCGDCKEKYAIIRMTD